MMSGLASLTLDEIKAKFALIPDSLHIVEKGH
jgi:hypothetical protein